MNAVISQLQEQIETQHQDALRALQVLRRYLEQSELPSAISPRVGTNGASLAGGHGKSRRATGIKKKIFALIRTEYATAGQLSQQTGYTLKQVRGVLNAPTLKGALDKREENGEMTYRLKANVKD